MSTLSDDEIFAVMRPIIDSGDGGYLCDTEPERVIAAGRALLAHPKVMALEGVCGEYNRWIHFHSGGGDFDEFLRAEIGGD